MNIILQDIDGRISCRPDTTWERENKDIYAPDFVCGYSYAPVLFARISKAGKCVGAKFAGRYYDAMSYGLMLYPHIADGSLCSIMDHSSVLPFPMYNRVVFESGENRFVLRCDGEEVFSTCCGSEAMVEGAIVAASALVSLRIGDIIAIELDVIKPLPQPADYKSAGTYISATFCDNPLFDFHIK